MRIERINNEILIRVPASTDLTGLQQIWDYIRFREIASKSKATQKQIDDLANGPKNNWWKENEAQHGTNAMQTKVIK
ncbi:MAG: hypothetical protein ACPGQR_05705 [Marinirhabdus sp.]